MLRITPLNPFRLGLLRGWFVTAVVAGWALVSAAAEQVVRWQPHDFSFTAQTKPANPFLIRFTATVKDPSGRTFVQPGFYDGDNTWKIRVTANQNGAWSLATQSELPELDAQSRTFICAANANPRIHGALRVDPRHPRHFVFEDGARFFLLGYECDWLWALDAGDPKLPVLNPFLDKLAASGFNYLILSVYSHDTRWRPDTTAADDYGPPPLFPWAGSNEQPDHLRFNLAYWRHFDRMMQALHERGLQAHLLIKVYNKMVNWPERLSAGEDLLFHWLIARYAAYPNIIWDFAKEAHREKNLDYKLNRLGFIRANDPYRRLLTVHDDDAANDSGAYDALTDFRADQKHTNFFNTIIKQHQRRTWPVANLEFGYECGPGGPDDRTSSRAQWPEEVVRRAWEIAMAGGYPGYYYTYTAFDVIRPADAPKGYAYFKNFRDFFATTRYWELMPAPELASEGFTLAHPGREYVVFLEQAKPFRLTLELRDTANAEWFNPLTGRRVPAGMVKSGVNEMRPPAGWNQMAVLQIKASP